MSVLLYMTSRDLWLDEAMLAYSFNTRGFFDLTSAIFEWDQSAPILYLYIVKIITILFGTSETTLRIYSFITFIATLAISYRLMDKAFKVRYPILCVAFIANMSVLLYYSNEFKPYMSDCFSVLLVLFLYYLFKERKLKLYPLSILYAAIIWLSYPTIFFIGGIYIYEFINSLIKKNQKLALMIVSASFLVLVSFFIQYMVWLRPVANSEYMINFWEYYRFPLIPKSFEELKKMFILASDLIAGMKYGIIFMGYLIFAGVWISIRRRNTYAIVIFIGTMLVLVASWVGKYPFYQRLMLFIYPLLAMSIFIAIDSLMKENYNWRRNIMALGLICAVLLSNYGSTSYLQESGRYLEKQEVSKLIEYVDENIEGGQMLYVYYYAIPVFSYINGYDNLHIGKNLDENTENVILGENIANKFENDIGTIIGLDACYILMTTQTEESIAPLMEALNENGEVALVMEDYGTPLYLYTKGD